MATKYKCPVHGEIDEASGLVKPKFPARSGNEYCARCLADWLVDSFPVRKIEDKSK